MSRSAETLNSMPVVQCFAIALVSSDCVEKGGSIPASKLLHNKATKRQTCEAHAYLSKNKKVNELIDFICYYDMATKA